MLFDFIWIWPLSSHNSRQFHIKSQRICERNKQQHDLVKSFKISACQKHDFCLKKVHRSSLAFLFIFSGKKTPWDITGNLDLYVYIYIYLWVLIHFFSSEDELLFCQLWGNDFSTNWWLLLAIFQSQRTPEKGALFCAPHDTRCSHRMSLF